MSWIGPGNREKWAWKDVTAQSPRFCSSANLHLGNIRTRLSKICTMLVCNITKIVVLCRRAFPYFPQIWKNMTFDYSVFLREQTKSNTKCLFCTCVTPSLGRDAKCQQRTKFTSRSTSIVYAVMLKMCIVVYINTQKTCTITVGESEVYPV